MVKKTVIITGASRGIGLHLSQRFLQEDFNVIGVSRSDSPIKHPSYRQLNADLSDPLELDGIVQSIKGEVIHGLINNAGVHGPVGPFEHIPYEAWEHTFQLNLFAPAVLARSCIPSLRREKGFVIFLSGGGSAFPRMNYSAYGVSKCAVVRLADTLALELTPDVFVYCIAPGPNRTDLLDEVIKNGESVNEEDIVDFSLPEDLCIFLARNSNIKYSGKFIHVKDDYGSWDNKLLEYPAYTLRRIDRRTLATVDLGQF